MINMVEAYNFYLGGYLPKVSPKTNVHNKHELKTKYKNILSLNNAIPLVMVKLSNDTQSYALKVKELSMELGEVAEDALEGRQADVPDHLGKMTDIFNDLLSRSDRYGEKTRKPSRPGGELRNLVEKNAGELIEAGFSIDEKGFLTSPTEEEAKVPQNFMEQLADKCEHMSMNPMEYVEQKVYSYAHLYRNDIGTAYESSLYSGMLFNSYC